MSIKEPENNGIAAPQRAEFVGEIILLARELEQQLHILCNSDAAGLHNLTNLAGAMLSVSTQRRLHYIAAIRNQAAHEADFSLSSEEFANYRTSVEQVKSELTALLGQMPEKADAESEDQTLKIEVEEELYENIQRKLALLGYLPLAGLIYSAYLLLAALFGQFFTLLGVLVYICSVILAVRGIDSDRGLLYVALFFLSAVYLITAVLGIKAPPIRKIPKIIWLLPGINIIYFVLRWIKHLPWGKLLLSAATLTAFAVGIILLGKKMTSLGILLLACSYAGSITSSWLWGKKRDE